MEFRTLGPLEVLEDERQIELGGAKQRALLAILLLHANEVVSTDRLIDALWEDEPPETAQKALQVYVSTLRKALGKDRLETKAPGYRLVVSYGELDLERFQRLAEEEPRQALALWHGQPLAEFSNQRFAQSEIARLDELRLACLEQRIEEDLEQGRHARLVGELERLVREHPLRERLRAQLMLALYRSGRQAEALEVFQDARHVLTEELGIEPRDELKRLQRAILAQDLSLAPPEQAQAVAPAEAKPAPPPPAGSISPREVRKTVTILFADVAGSTELGERFDPEALRRVLGRYFQEMSIILERHGATVEKFVGDAVLAVFGIPSVHEDDPVRAVRAAVEMRERLASLNEELEQQWGIRLAIRIGVNTGEVVAGGTNAPTYATGDAVNVAARLQQAASPGEVLLGRETYRFVRDVVRAETLDPKAVKGKGTPVDSVRLLDLVADGRPGKRFESPMVGRQRERRRLHDAFEQAVADRSCQLFTILGAAGVGKSRLVREFVGDVADAALVAHGRCLPYGEGITYWPVLEAVRYAAGLDDADTPEESLAKLAALLDETGDGGVVVPRLAEVIGLAEESSSAEDSFGAVRTFFEAVARRQPLVLVFDDVHWGEPTFLELVDHVTDWTREAPILLVCIARPELLEVRPDWGGGKLNAVTALLEPLSDTQSAELVDNLAGTSDLEDSTRRQVVEAAAGNPLFAEEMLALVLDEGRSGAALKMPPTIHALLAARLDRLPEPERAALEAASVEGQVFHDTSVAELVARPRIEVASGLQTLLRKDLIRPETPVFSGEAAYRFRHILIRDAAYESIPKTMRATLHERHADWLERKTGERALEFEEILGYHLEQAFRHRSDLGPVDENDRRLARRAATRLGAAGRRAFMRVDAPAGVKLIARAVALLPANDPLRLDFVPNVRAVQGSGDVEWAEAILNEAIASGDTLLQAHARVQQGFLRLFFTSPDVTAPELIGVAQEAIAVFEPLHDDLGLARAWRLVGQAEYLARRGAASTEAALRALEFGRRAGDRFEQVETIDWLGVTLVLGPTHASEGIRICEQLLREVSGDSMLELTVLGPLAYFVGIQGRREEAEALIERGRRIVDELHERVWLFSVMLGFYFAWASGPAAAERDLRPVYEGLKEIGEKSHLCSMATVLAQAVYAQGRYDEADELAREAGETARANDVHSHIIWRATRAKVLARRGDVHGAEALAQEAVAFAEASDFLNSQAEALMDLGEVFELSGRAAEAVPLVERAIELHERKGNIVAADLARTRLDRLGAHV